MKEHTTTAYIFVKRIEPEFDPVSKSTGTFVGNLEDRGTC